MSPSSARRRLAASLVLLSLVNSASAAEITIPSPLPVNVTLTASSAVTQLSINIVIPGFVTTTTSTTPSISATISASPRSTIASSSSRAVTSASSRASSSRATSSRISSSARISSTRASSSSTLSSTIVSTTPSSSVDSNSSSSSSSSSVLASSGLAEGANSGGNAASSNAGRRLSGGAIAGIVVGVLAAVALVILLVICCIRKRRKDNHPWGTGDSRFGGGIAGGLGYGAGLAGGKGRGLAAEGAPWGTSKEAQQDFTIAKAQQYTRNTSPQSSMTSFGLRRERVVGSMASMTTEEALVNYLSTGYAVGGPHAAGLPSDRDIPFIYVPPAAHEVPPRTQPNDLIRRQAHYGNYPAQGFGASGIPGPYPDSGRMDEGDMEILRSPPMQRYSHDPTPPAPPPSSMQSYPQSFATTSGASPSNSAPPSPGTSGAPLERKLSASIRRKPVPTVDGMSPSASAQSPFFFDEEPVFGETAASLARARRRTSADSKERGMARRDRRRSDTSAKSAQSSGRVRNFVLSADEPLQPDSEPTRYELGHQL